MSQESDDLIQRRFKQLMVEHGQGLIEYALLLMLVAFVVFALVIAFGGSVGQLYSNIVRAL